ncbi:MAG: M16 family metallopeptidase [Myxococcota bacterium]
MQDIFTKNIEKTILPSGLTIITQSTTLVPVTAVNIRIDAGASDEEKKAGAGLAHFIEHMLFKGTAARGVGKIAQEVENLGGSINAYTSFDETVYHVVMPASGWLTGLDVLLDALLSSTFDEKEMEKEKKVVLEELEHRNNSPSALASNDIFSLVYQNYHYGYPIIGRRETINEFTKEDLENFIYSRYTPDKTTIVVVGDVEHQQVVTEVKSRYHFSSKGVHKYNRRRSFKVGDKMITLKKGPWNEAYFNLGFYTDSFDLMTASALDILGIILGEGESSRLEKVLKLQRDLALYTYAWNFAPADTGCFLVGCVLPPENIIPAIEIIKSELQKLREISLSELNKAKMTLKSDQISTLQTVQGTAGTIGYYNSLIGDPAGESEYLKYVNNHNLKSLKMVYDKYFSNPLKISLVVPQSSKVEKDKIKKVLLSPPPEKESITLEKPEGVGIRKSHLQNGITLITVEDHSLPFVTIRVGWQGGLLAENTDNNGISQLLSSVIIRGSKLYSGEEIHRKLEEKGGKLISFSGRNSFGLRLDVLSENLDEGMDLLAQTMLFPLWNPQEFEREKKLLQETLISEKDRHGYQTVRLFEKALYGTSHPYGLNISGSESSLATMELDQLAKYWQEHYPLDKMTITLVGDFSPERVKNRLNFLLGQIKSSTTVGKLPLKFDDYHKVASLTKKVDISQTHLMFGVKGTTIQEKQRFPLEVIASVLSGQSGRLFLDLRDEQSLAYDVQAMSLEGLAPGYFACYLAVSPESLQKSVEEVLKHYRRLQNEIIGEEEFHRTREYLIGSHQIGLQHRTALAAAIFYGELYGIGMDSYQNYRKRINQVTKQQVQEIAREYFTEERFVLSAYGKGIEGKNILEFIG